MKEEAPPPQQHKDKHLGLSISKDLDAVHNGYGWLKMTATKAVVVISQRHAYLIDLPIRNCQYVTSPINTPCEAFEFTKDHLLINGMPFGYPLILAYQSGQNPLKLFTL
jgi:cyanophycinase-like exopeptidase